MSDKILKRKKNGMGMLSRKGSHAHWKLVIYLSCRREAPTLISKQGLPEKGEDQIGLLIENKRFIPPGAAAKLFRQSIQVQLLLG
jgi:hypothetical protein